MNWRLSILLPAVHVMIALIIMLPEDLSEWREYEAHPDLKRFDEAERLRRRQERSRQHHLFAEGSGLDATGARLGNVMAVSGDGGPAVIDYRYPSAVRAMHFINIPASVLVGWYEHTIFPYHPLLWPVLGVAADATPLGERIIVLDLVFVATIALQWWLIGKLIDFQRKRQGSRPLWIQLIRMITFSGIICALMSPFFRSGWVDLPASLAALAAGCGWMAVAYLALGKSAVWCSSKVKRFARQRS